MGTAFCGQLHAQAPDNGCSGCVQLSTYRPFCCWRVSVNKPLEPYSEAYT